MTDEKKSAPEVPEGYRILSLGPNSYVACAVIHGDLLHECMGSKNQAAWNAKLHAEKQQEIGTRRERARWEAFAETECGGHMPPDVIRIIQRFMRRALEENGGDLDNIVSDAEQDGAMMALGELRDEMCQGCALEIPLDTILDKHYHTTMGGPVLCKATQVREKLEKVSRRK